MKYRLIVLALGVLAVSVPLFAQSSIGDPAPLSNAAPVPEPRWGTSGVTSYVIGAWEFDPYVSTSTPLTGGPGAQRGGGTAGANYEAHPHLPSGALVTGIEIQGCDNSVTSQITAAIYTCDTVGSCTLMGQVATGAATNTCSYFGAGVTPYTVDNFNNTNDVEVNLGSPTGNSFSGVRIYYQLQVSTPPVTASFTDVPTSHPFYQYIEALKASGITGGCVASPPQYCPDAPITRGQMAVFLARALGLYFPF